MADSHLDRRLDEAARASSVDPRDFPLARDLPNPPSRRDVVSMEDRIVARNEVLFGQAVDFEETRAGRPLSGAFTRPNFKRYYEQDDDDWRADREADRYERDFERRFGG